MIRSILVPLDGSKFAEAALPLATALADRTKAKLRLLTVHEPRPDLPAGLDAPAVEGENVELRSAAQAYLSETADRLGQPGGAPPRAELIDGAPGPGLVEAVGRFRPDLVVMATHGRGPMSRFWLGSVADHFIRHGTTPVLLVRPGKAEPPSAVRKVLAAVDLSDESARILDAAGALARAFEAELVLYHVVEPLVGMVDGALPFPMPVAPGSLDRAKDEANRRMAELGRLAAERGLTAEVRVVTGVGAAASILEEAREGYDLIAMTTHGAGGVRRLLLGSVADKVIRASELPVLVFRGETPPA
ncbi:MAG: universal stress protein [Gemmatimonadales bacterium]